MDLFESLLLDATETVSLVPPDREDIERYLPTDREREPTIREFLTQNIDKLLADLMLIVVSIEFQTFLVTKARFIC